MEKDLFITRLIKPLSPSPVSIEASENLRKQTMLSILSLLGILFLFLMSILLFVEGAYYFSTLNLILGAFLVVLFLLIRRGRRIRLYSILSITILQIFFLYLVHSGAGDQMAFVWYYLYPLIALFLLGTQTGLFLSVWMIGLSVLLNSFSGHIPTFIHIPIGKILRIFISYMGVTLFAVVFERTRLITQNKLEDTMAKLNELAIRDSLTGLYNRRYMDEVIFQMVQQCQRSGMTIGFIMADIDYFKMYNDTYGHPAGDVLLADFAKMLLSLVRRQTDFVFRYGGGGVCHSSSCRLRRNHG